MLGITLLASLATLFSLSSAIKITSPAENSTVAAGGKTTLTWTTVDTVRCSPCPIAHFGAHVILQDPSTFSIFLVNFVNWPPSLVGLAYNIDTTKGSADVQIPCNTNPSFGYQFNAINGTVGSLIEATPSDSC